MKNIELEAADCGQKSQCANRRQFLTRSVAGGLIIALSGATLVKSTLAHGADDHGDGEHKGDVAAAEGEAAPTAAQVPVPVAANELVIKPSDYPALEKVGGFVILETEVGKITVARVSQTQFAAVGAVCTHKGGPIEYNAGAKQFFCPWHNSKFDLKGAVTKGPAKIALPNYQQETATVIQLS